MNQYEKEYYYKQYNIYVCTNCCVLEIPVMPQWCKPKLNILLISHQYYCQISIIMLVLVVKFCFNFLVEIILKEISNYSKVQRLMKKFIKNLNKQMLSFKKDSTVI